MVSDKLDELRAVNVARCTSVDGFCFALHDHSLLEWSACLAGEAGELCNAAKKMNYGRGSTKDLSDELADVVIYCDLMAAAMGVDLWSIVVEKFNATSEKRGVPYRLATRTPSPPPCPKCGGSGKAPGEGGHG